MKQKPTKAKKHESKGDELLKKKKYAKAIGEYEKALKEDPNLPDVYEKMIKAKELLPDEWDMKDFAETVTWTMKKQELEYPPIRHVHAKLKPEWEAARKIAATLLCAKGEEEEKKLIEEHVAMGEISTRVLAEMIVEFKKKAKGD